MVVHKNEKVTKEFLEKADEKEFPDMTVRINQRLIDIILEYRQHILGFNVRLLLELGN